MSSAESFYRLVSYPFHEWNLAYETLARTPTMCNARIPAARLNYVYIHISCACCLLLSFLFPLFIRIRIEICFHVLKHLPFVSTCQDI